MSENEQEKYYEEITVHWTKAQPVISAFILSVVPSVQAAEDILQEVALDVVRSYKNYNKDKSFIAWSLGVAKNEILVYRRKHARDRHIFDEELVDKIGAVYQEKSDEIQELKSALKICIAKLQSRAQKILKMRYSWGLDVRQISTQLGTSSNAVFVALHRIRTALNECIARHLNVEKT